jgi:hypothetical protein
MDRTSFHCSGGDAVVDLPAKELSLLSFLALYPSWYWDGRALWCPTCRRKR